MSLGIIESDGNLQMLPGTGIRAAPSAAPQWPQNLAAEAFSKPHDAQGVLNGVPHSLQNFSPSGFSVLHFAQRTCPSTLYALSSSSSALASFRSAVSKPSVNQL
jgi:hypothetical protein